MRTTTAAAITLALAASAFGTFIACGPEKGSHDDEGGAEVAAAVTPAEVSASEKARVSNTIKTVWIIVMENHDWSTIKGSPSAPYINGTLLKLGAHAEHYTSPYGIHPSEPNYIWLEAGHDLGIGDDDGPLENYRTTKNHLTTHLETHGVSWKSYQEGISGENCPLTSTGKYRPKHNPMVFFDDVTNGRNAGSKRCIDHVRPYEELARDLTNDTLPRYNFVTPDICNDMHDSKGCATPDSIANGDAWLAREVPKILESKAYQEGGALFVTWDESEGSDFAPIGLIALSPFVKPGFESQTIYTHSSLLRTVQDVFAVKPYLRDAQNVPSLGDMFIAYP
jgi:phosphatidylinositol-3-phosphatase